MYIIIITHRFRAGRFNCQVEGARVEKNLYAGIITNTTLHPRQQ